MPTLADPNYRHSWRGLFRLLGLLLALATALWWYAAGANRGWTMTRVPQTQIDEVTEIEYVVYAERFVPGIELLVLGVVGGLVMFGSTFFRRFNSSRP